MMKMAPNIEIMSNTPLKLVEKSIFKLILVQIKKIGTTIEQMHNTQM